MNDMSHDAHALLGAYVLDAVDDVERAAFEAHLAACEACREEAASLREVVAQLADAEATPPPTSLRGAVMDRVGRTAQVPPTPGHAPTTNQRHHSGRASRPRRRLALTLAAAAALVVAVAGIGAGIGASRHGDEISALERDVMTLASAPDAHAMELDLGQSHLVMSDRMDEVAVMGHDAPMPSAGMEYQLWLVLDDGTTMAGPTFMPDHEGDVMALASMDGHPISAFAVTEEPHGGSASPTGRVVARVSV